MRFSEDVLAAETGEDHGSVLPNSSGLKLEMSEKGKHNYSSQYAGMRHITNYKSIQNIK